MIRHFDLAAPLYDRVLGRPGGERLRRLLGVPRGGRLLDAGGGTGRVAAIFSDGSVRPCVVDLSRPMLSRARGKGIPAVMGRTESLPFPDRSFMGALVVDALHHFQDQARAVAECMRVLAPGGRLVIEEPDIRRWVVRGVALAEWVTGMGSRFHHPREILQMVAAAGGAGEIAERDLVRVWIVGRKPVS